MMERPLVSDQPPSSLLLRIGCIPSHCRDLVVDNGDSGIYGSASVWNDLSTPLVGLGAPLELPPRLAMGVVDRETFCLEVH